MNNHFRKLNPIDTPAQEDQKSVSIIIIFILILGDTVMLGNSRENHRRLLNEYDNVC